MHFRGFCCWYVNVTRLFLHPVAERRPTHCLVSGFGCTVSEEWPLPARVLQLCFLSVEGVRVLVDIKCLTRGNKLVVFSLPSIGASSSPKNAPSGWELRGDLVGRYRSQKALQIPFQDTTIFRVFLECAYLFSFLSQINTFFLFLKKNCFIVVQLQLSPFSPHYSPLP